MTAFAAASSFLPGKGTLSLPECPQRSAPCAREAVSLLCFQVLLCSLALVWCVVYGASGPLLKQAMCTGNSVLALFSMAPLFACPCSEWCMVDGASVSPGKQAMCTGSCARGQWTTRSAQRRARPTLLPLRSAANPTLRSGRSDLPPALRIQTGQPTWEYSPVLVGLALRRGLVRPCSRSLLIGPSRLCPYALSVRCRRANQGNPRGTRPGAPGGQAGTLSAAPWPPTSLARALTFIREACE